MDQRLTIRALLLTGRHRYGNSTAGHPRSSPALLPPPSSALTGRILSGQSTKTNKAVSDATTEFRVVMLFACAEWRGVALSPTYWLPTGRLFSNFQAVSLLINIL